MCLTLYSQELFSSEVECYASIGRDAKAASDLSALLVDLEARFPVVEPSR
jgi:hypothetical protein